MNDFERQLRRQPFRQPPADLRVALFGDETAASNIVTPPSWTWRDWLWPSPSAWAALAALWLIFAATQFIGLEAGTPSRVTTTAQNDAAVSDVPLTLFAYHNTRDLSHVLDLPN